MCLKRNDLNLASLGIVNRQCVDLGAMQRPGVDDESRAGAVGFGLVSVAVTYEVIVPGVFFALESSFVVAVQESDFSAGQFQFAKLLATDGAGSAHRRAQGWPVIIDVPENEIRFEIRKGLNHGRVGDVAAVQDRGNAERFEQPHGPAYLGAVAVAIAEDADLHRDHCVGAGFLKWVGCKWN